MFREGERSEVKDRRVGPPRHEYYGRFMTGCGGPLGWGSDCSPWYVQMLCDFACYGPIAYDKTKTGIDFGDGWIGITGVVSSLISLRTVWKKQK